MKSNFFATKTVVHLHLSSSHLSILSKRENKRGQMEKQELSQRYETAPVREATRPFQPGKVGGKSTDLWDQKQHGVRELGNKLSTNSSSRRTEGRRQRQQHADSNSHRRWFVWQWVRKPQNYCWQRVLWMQKVCSGSKGRLDRHWRRNLLRVTKQINHGRLKQVNHWETIGGWDASCEKYHIHLFCFLWFTAHQLMGTDKKKTKTTKLNALFILTTRNIFYIYELGQYTSSHISALGESLEETLKWNENSRLEA